MLVGGGIVFVFLRIGPTEIESAAVEAPDGGDEKATAKKRRRTGARGPNAPYSAHAADQVVHDELALRAIDEIAWARGGICFAQLWKVGPDTPQAGLAGWLRASGIRIVAAARRDLALVRDYVNILQKEIL